MVNDQTGGFRPNVQGSNQENWCQCKGNQGQNYGNYNREGHYVGNGKYNHDNNFNQTNYGNRNSRSGPYVPPQNLEVAPRDGLGSTVRVKDMLSKMMMMFDASDVHTKKLRSDLASIGQKVDAHVISIKHLSCKWLNCL